MAQVAARSLTVTTEESHVFEVGCGFADVEEADERFLDEEYRELDPVPDQVGPAKFLDHGGRSLSLSVMEVSQKQTTLTAIKPNTTVPSPKMVEVQQIVMKT